MSLIVEVRCAIWDWKTDRDTIQVFPGYRINAVFMARKAKEDRSWFLIHERTGYSAGSFRSLAAARRAGNAVLTAYGPKIWNFSKPSRAKGLGRVRDFLNAGYERL